MFAQELSNWANSWIWPFVQLGFPTRFATWTRDHEWDHGDVVTLQKATWDLMERDEQVASLRKKNNKLEEQMEELLNEIRALRPIANMPDDKLLDLSTYKVRSAYSLYKTSM